MTAPASRPRCYVASPLGFTEGGRDYYRRSLLPGLATVVEPVDPWALATAEEFAAAEASGDPEASRALALDIGARNAAAIRTCTLLVAYLEGQEPDSGTVAELGYACGLGMRCFGLRSDTRQAGEPGVALNLQVEAFVQASGGVIARSLDELLALLAGAC